MRLPLVLILAWSSLAEPSGDKLPLSLARAVEIALSPDGNTRVKLARESIEQAKSRRQQALGALLPNVDGAIGYQEQTRNLKALGLSFDSLTGLPFQVHFPTIVGPFDVFDARATLQQSVFDFAAIRRYRAAKASEDTAKADQESVRDQVADQVARAYLTTLRAAAARDTAKAGVELSEALLKLARSQKIVGTGTGIEVTRAQVQLANDRQRLIVAESDLRRISLQLLRVIGLELDAEVDLTDRLAYVPMEAVDLERALVMARETRSELKAQKQREETARLSYSAVKMERLPSVGGFADYGSSGTALNSSIPTHTAGFSVRVPIFDGGRRDARRAESFSQYRQEQIRTKDLQEQVALDVRTSLDSLKSAESQVATANEGLGLAENELAQARRRYEAGVTNSIEVTDAQTRLDRARDNQVAALYNYNLAVIDLSTAMGTIRNRVAGGK